MSDPDQTARVESADPLIGKVLGGCQILEKLGQGAMGAVYLGKHIALNRLVAVKILPPEKASNRDARERFIREGRAAAKLEHPNVVQVFDAGEQDSVTFLVMQLIQGRSLGKWLEQRKRLDHGQACQIMREIAKGLAAAHKVGIIHRDVKPDNIMITKEGVVKIADFGLVAVMEAEGDAKRLRPAGTPYYMSPEQWTAQAVDARTDLYSLGVTFYQIVAGQRPFENPNIPALKTLHLTGQPPALHGVQSDVPPEVEAVISKLMEKKPQNRYASALELIKDLDRIREGQEPMAMSKSQNTLECPFCSSLNPVHSRRCSLCGEHLGSSQKIEVVLMEGEFMCTKCSTILQKGCRSCKVCGHPICTRCGVRLAGKDGLCDSCRSSVPSAQRPHR